MFRNPTKGASVKKGLARMLVIAIVSAAMPCAAGCEGEVSFTTAKLSEATMAQGVNDENKPVNPTNTFAPDSPQIWCSVKLSNAPEDTEVNSIWIYVGGELEDVTDFEIDQFSVVTDGTRYISFSMNRPDNGWPRGDYELGLYVDGKESETLPFSVA